MVNISTTGSKLNSHQDLNLQQEADTVNLYFVDLSQYLKYKLHWYSNMYIKIKRIERFHVWQASSEQGKKVHVN